MKTKKSQAELITTVLLILVSIAAVVLVSTFIISMVRQNLEGTNCFKTSGQLSINLQNQKTYFDSANNKVYVQINRGEKDFNLTGISISVASSSIAKSFNVKVSDSDSAISMYDGEAVSLPGLSEIRTYVIDLAGKNIGNITSVKIAPIMYPNKICQEGVDEQLLPESS